MGMRSINEIILDNYLQEMIEKSCNEIANKFKNYESKNNKQKLENNKN